MDISIGFSDSLIIWQKRKSELMKYTLKQIQVFLAAARFQNLSRAAKSLHMSQSAASEALLNLEKAYDVKLFDRRSNRLELNPTGQILRPEAEKMMEQCLVFDEKLSGHRDIGHLKVGASFTIGNHLATRYLAGYLGDHPHADVQLDTANTPDVVNKVLNYEVDIGMIELEVQHRDLELIPWRDDELLVFCSASHPLARKKAMTVKDIRSAAWILREPDSGARYTFEKALADLLPDINIYLEFKHNEAIKNAVESGLGIGCLSRIVLQKNIESGDLVPLKLPRRNMRRKFYFVLPKKRYYKSAVESWMEVCKTMDRNELQVSNS